MQGLLGLSSHQLWAQGLLGLSSHQLWAQGLLEYPQGDQEQPQGQLQVQLQKGLQQKSLIGFLQVHVHPSGLSAPVLNFFQSLSIVYTTSRVSAIRSAAMIDVTVDVSARPSSLVDSSTGGVIRCDLEFDY